MVSIELEIGFGVVRSFLQHSAAQPTSVNRMVDLPRANGCDRIILVFIAEHTNL